MFSSVVKRWDANFMSLFVYLLKFIEHLLHTRHGFRSSRNVHAPYMLLNSEWSSAHHSSYLKSGQFLPVWITGLGRRERGKSWFPCRVWQWERVQGLRDWVSEHHASATPFKASCLGCLFSVLMGIWEQTWLNSFLSLSCTIISGQKEASN